MGGLLLLVTSICMFGMCSMCISDTPDIKDSKVANNDTYWGDKKTEEQESKPEMIKSNATCFRYLDNYLKKENKKVDEKELCEFFNKNEIVTGWIFKDYTHSLSENYCAILAYAAKNGKSGKYGKEVRSMRANKCSNSEVRFFKKLNDYPGLSAKYLVLVSGYKSTLESSNRFYKSEGYYNLCVRATGTTELEDLYTGLATVVNNYEEGSEKNGWADSLWNAKAGKATKKVAYDMLKEEIIESDVLCEAVYKRK